MAKAPATDVVAELSRTTQAQNDAADPAASVWVSANAGTGKTHVLTNRVLRLMLAGTAPERILCLTYTKAAAAEMSKRVFDKLASWATAEEASLATELTKLEGVSPSSERIGLARVLFARAIESPGGLKVQTIHAFCQSLLQRFPLEAGVPPGFSVLDDATTRELEREAIDGVLLEASAASGSLLADALRTTIAHAADDRFDEMLREALGCRPWLEAVQRLGVGGNEDPLVESERLYRRHFGVRGSGDLAAVRSELARVLDDTDMRRLVDALSASSANDVKQAERLRPALGAAGVETRVGALRSFFLTDKDEPRKSLMTNPVKKAQPDLDQAAQRASDRFVAFDKESRALAVIAHTMALIALASAAMQRFTQAKARRAALDFDDLIARATSLLEAPGGAAQWVLYKLDGGLDHVLVDESQDTSPSQWRIVDALAQDFFADAGAGAVARTLFAVGDEKQSIYSFQGAAPHLFAEMGTRFAKAVEWTGRPWRRIPLQLSFRTVAPVLDAVDATFADPARTPGLGSAAAIRHIAARAGQAGLVEIWSTEPFEETGSSEPWSPLEEARAAASPVSRLAGRIASTVRGWIDGGEVLASLGRPVRPGDVLILVRKRNPFAGPMVAALKAQGIAVAGADRIDLAEQIAVQDLVSLGSFLTLPEDDLALAEVLKSPIFDLDDDDLMAIAPGRKGTLWKALLEGATTRPRLVEAVELLRRWRREADFTPPYEFLAGLLDHDGVRKRLLARLGPEASEPIDELMALAMRYDEEEPPSLAGFLDWLRAAKREVKRDMEHGRDEVRVMTVHGAKGLEAPIVFLPDTCTTRSGGPAGGLIRLPQMKRPEDLPVPFCWAVKGTGKLDAIAAAKAQREAAEAEERYRLLYVAMTRARDRLYVAGFEGKRGRAPGCWYDLISEALKGTLQEAAGADGRPARRISAPQMGDVEKDKTVLAAAELARQPPEWARRKAPREIAVSIPMAPSRLAPYDVDEEGEPLARPSAASPMPLDEPPSLPPGPQASDNRFLRGTITHALLQHLPSFPDGERREAAKAFVASRGAVLTKAARASIVRETLAILDHPDFAALFGPGSRAEVPIVAEIAPPPGRTARALEINGQIDRLVVLSGSVLIVDYKTNRPPPHELAGVAEAYLLQLAAYRTALAGLYPGRAIRAALLWTDGPRLMEVPAAVLDAAAARLFDAAARQDASIDFN